MTVVEAVQAALVTALSGRLDASRIRPAGQYHNIEPPYVIHRPIVAPAYVLTYDGQAGPAVWRSYQIDIYAQTALEASQLGDRIATRLWQSAPEGWRMWLAPGAGMLLQDDTGLWRNMLEISVVGG